MQEVKNPKKPMIFYYLIVLLVILSLNFIVLPIFTEHQVKEVDYSKFMQMINKKEIGSVNIESNQIIFTDKDETHIYKTGVIEDPQVLLRDYQGNFPVYQPVGRIYPSDGDLCRTGTAYGEAPQFQDGRRHGCHAVWNGEKQCQSLCQIYQWHQIQ